MDVATANNTVAIVMANPIAAEMSEEYGITHSKAASLLDTFSCISQGVIPYGAQMLVALSAVHEMGHELSAFDVIPKLFYPGMLLTVHWYSSLHSLRKRTNRLVCSLRQRFERAAVFLNTLIDFYR